MRKRRNVPQVEAEGRDLSPYPAGNFFLSHRIINVSKKSTPAAPLKRRRSRPPDMFYRRIFKIKNDEIVLLCSFPASRKVNKTLTTQENAIADTSASADHAYNVPPPPPTFLKPRLSFKRRGYNRPLKCSRCW